MVLATDYANVYLCPSGVGLQMRADNSTPSVGPAVNQFQCADGSTPQVYNPLLNSQKPDLTGKSAWVAPGVTWDAKNDIKSFVDHLTLIGWIILIILIVLVVMIIASFIMNIVSVSRLGKLTKDLTVWKTEKTTVF